MKKILILSDGFIAKNFIERVINTYSSENIYYVVEMHKQITHEFSPARFKFYEFDPTSLSKISNLLKMDFVQVIIALDTPQDTINSFKNIRMLNNSIQVVILDLWKLNINDDNAVIINAHEQLSSRLLDYLPNVPVIAQNVGLGEGEIMELLVPFGSSFVYRHIGAIKQNKWRISAIYRNHKLILPENEIMIQANDVLLLIGESRVLKSVYLSIKRELGQFPAPFGERIYLLIDMYQNSFEEIKSLVENALYMSQKFSKQLFIRVVNVNCFDALEYIKSLSAANITIEINYNNKSNMEALIDADIKRYQVGVILVSSKSFLDDTLRLMLYRVKIPVLKLAHCKLNNLKEAIVLLNENKTLEKISAIVFDISVQLGFNLELINYLNEHQEEKKEVIEHYANLSSIFSKKIKIEEIEENPIRYMKKRTQFLQALAFTKAITHKRFTSLFSTDSERLYYKLDSFHQIFIPSDL